LVVHMLAGGLAGIIQLKCLLTEAFYVFGVLK
jgi:hypothetical protein